MAHSEIKDGLVESGIPQINADQLNQRYAFENIAVMTQKEFDDWFDEIENYCLRSERFHDEFVELDYIKRQRMVEWLQAAWYCAREKGDKND